MSSLVWGQGATPVRVLQRCRERPNRRYGQITSLMLSNILKHEQCWGETSYMQLSHVSLIQVMKDYDSDGNQC